MLMEMFHILIKALSFHAKEGVRFRACRVLGFRVEGPSVVSEHQRTIGLLPNPEQPSTLLAIND